MHITVYLYKTPQSINYLIVLSSVLKSMMAAEYDDLSESNQILLMRVLQVHGFSGDFTHHWYKILYLQWL
jgi:hypothetical protein